MRKIFPLVVACASFLGIRAQTPIRAYVGGDPALAPRDHSLDFTHLRLEITPEPATGAVKGKVTEYFTPLRPSVDSFFLDGIQMTIRSISLNGEPVPYRSDSAGITILPGKPLQWNTEDSLTISYEATPRRGLYFVGWNDKNNLSRKQIWSQGESKDNRYWIPMYDGWNDKMVTELIVNFDKAYQVLSNGGLISKQENADGTDTWHYLMRHPQSSYLIMLGIGKYAIKETHSASGVPMHLYYYPDSKDRAEPTYQYSEAIMDFYEKEIGINFPWESYSQIPVQDYMFGAMENTTATVFGDFYLVDRRGAIDRNYVSVNAHELAHQWFGDYITARSTAHEWLQEGFATYYSQLFEREAYGEDFFNWQRRSTENTAVQESIYNTVGIANSNAASAHIYGKAAFVLNMLKYVVGGGEAYNRAVKYYLENHPYQNVDSHDLLIAFEENTGMDLEWFWDEWVYRGGEPDYHVSLDDQKDQTELAIEQTQEPSDLTGYKNGLYRMPIWIEIHYTDNSVFRKQYWIEQQTEIIKIPNTDHKTIAFVLFDPGNEILKSVSFHKSFAMLQAQVYGADKMLDRYDALSGMRGISLEKKRDLLIDVYHKEKFSALKAEVLSQLSADSTQSAIALFKEALGDANVIVRKAALSFIDPNTSVFVPDLEKLLTDSSYEIIDTVLRKLAIAQPSRLPVYLKATKGVEGAIGRNVEIRWLEVAYLGENKTQYADQLVTFAGNSYEFRTRINAMAALKRSNYFSERLIENLVDAVLSPNVRLSIPAIDLLRFYYAEDKPKGAIGRYVRAGRWSGWQEKVLNEFSH